MPTRISMTFLATRTDTLISLDIHQGSRQWNQRLQYSQAQRRVDELEIQRDVGASDDDVLQDGGLCQEIGHLQEEDDAEDDAFV